MTPRTRLLALSHVLWTTGAGASGAELKGGAGLPILVDGAQSVGAIAVDARRARLLHGLRAEVALRARGDRCARRRRAGRAARGAAELPLPAAARAGRRVRTAIGGARASSRISSRAARRRGIAGCDAALARLEVREGAADRPNGAGSSSARQEPTSSSPRSAQRSCPGACPPRSLRASSRDSRRQA